MKCCDECRWAAREVWHDYMNSECIIIAGAPCACSKYMDDAHNQIAKDNRYCDDFECDE